MEVQWSDEKGRCLVAQHDVLAGALLIREYPLVVSSPSTASQQWQRLVSVHEESPFPMDPEWYLAAASTVAAAKLDLELASLISDKFRPDVEAARIVCGSELDTLRAMEAAGLHGLVSLDDFFVTLAIVRFNGFRSPREEHAIALYNQACLMSHSCCPSAEFDFEDSGCIVVRALKDISQGEEICISYLPAFALAQSTEMRRLKLESQLFECKCKRCLWPADLARGFCCSAPGCAGMCFLPGDTSCSEDRSPTASLPCSQCGRALAERQLDAVLQLESQYGFVVEYGSMQQDINVARGLAAEAASVFKQHWIMIAIMKALEAHCMRICDIAAADTCRVKLRDMQAAMLQPWPWLLNMSTASREYTICG